MGKVIDTSTELVDRIEDAFKGLEVDDKMPSLLSINFSFWGVSIFHVDGNPVELLNHRRQMENEYLDWKVPDNCTDLFVEKTVRATKTFRLISRHMG